jgi:hypothetical protein
MARREGGWLEIGAQRRYYNSQTGMLPNLNQIDVRRIKTIGAQTWFNHTDTVITKMT